MIDTSLFTFMWKVTFNIACMYWFCDAVQMYWVGPLVGGAVAALLYDLVFSGNASVAKAKAFFCRINYDDSQFKAPQTSENGVVWITCTASDHADPGLWSLGRSDGHFELLFCAIRRRVHSRSFFKHNLSGSSVPSIPRFFSSVVAA